MALRGEVSVLCRERLWAVVDLKRRYRNGLNEWMNKWMSDVSTWESQVPNCVLQESDMKLSWASTCGSKKPFSSGSKKTFAIGCPNHLVLRNLVLINLVLRNPSITSLLKFDNHSRDVAVPLLWNSQYCNKYLTHPTNSPKPFLSMPSLRIFHSTLLFHQSYSTHPPPSPVQPQTPPP